MNRVLDLLTNRWKFATLAFGGNDDYVLRRETEATAAVRGILQLDNPTIDHYTAMFWRLLCANPDLAPLVSRKHPNSCLDAYTPPQPVIHNATLVPASGATASVARIAGEWPLIDLIEVQIEGDLAWLRFGVSREPLQIRRNGDRIKVAWPEWAGVQGDLYQPSMPTDVTVRIFHMPFGVPFQNLRPVLAASPHLAQLLHESGLQAEFASADDARSVAVAAAALVLATEKLPAL